MAEQGNDGNVTARGVNRDPGPALSSAQKSTWSGVGYQMHRRTLMGAVVGLFGLSGCGSSEEKHTDEEWSQLLLEALEPLDHVDELTDFSYSMQGVFGFKTSAWISGLVISDTDDVAINEALLDEVGRTIATVHRDNPVKDSWVKAYVLSPSRTAYKFRDKLDKGAVGLEDLAEFYGVDR